MANFVADENSKEDISIERTVFVVDVLDDLALVEGRIQVLQDDKVVANFDEVWHSSEDVVENANIAKKVLLKKVYVILDSFCYREVAVYVIANVCNVDAVMANIVQTGTGNGQSGNKA